MSQALTSGTNEEKSEQVADNHVVGGIVGWYGLPEELGFPVRENYLSAAMRIMKNTHSTHRYVGRGREKTATS